MSTANLMRATTATVRAAVMGTEGIVSVGAESELLADELVATGFARLRELELLWSRFETHSDVSRINDNSGRPVRVDRRTLELIRTSILASRATNGLFSPLVGTAVIANGYAAPWQTGWSARCSASAPPSNNGIDVALLTDLEAVVLNDVISSVHITHGQAIDLGGIAKGYASDLVAEELIALGAEWVSIDLGGDIRFIDRPNSIDERPTAEGLLPEGRVVDAGCALEEGRVIWDVAIDDPFSPGEELGRWEISNGAVATSSSLRRHWVGADGTDVHHIVDPRTGTPTRGPLLVSIVAGRAADAEVLTKVAMVGGVAALRPWITEAHGALLLLSDRSIVTLGGIAPTLRSWSSPTLAATLGAEGHPQ